MSQLYRKSLLTVVALAAATTMAASSLSCAQDAPKPLPPRYTTLPPKKVPDFLRGTVMERMDHENPEPVRISSFGLVVNLPGTGEGRDGGAPSAVREYIIKEMQRRGFGIAGAGGSVQLEGFGGLTPTAVLEDPNKRTAIVRVDAYLPPGARKGQTFDAVVTALEDSAVTSLAGGTLWRAELKRGGANAAAPSSVFLVEGIAEGPIFINPTLTLNPKTTATTQGSSRIARRQGVILDGAIAKTDQHLQLRLRAPQRSTIKLIESRINQFFLVPKTAEAKNEAILQLTVPETYNGDWERFLGVATHLYLDGSTELAATKARILATEALKPDAPLLDISFCWEGMGEAALPAIQPLMDAGYPQDVQFAAARAAAFIGDPSAQQALTRIASTEGHRFQVEAVQTLGALRNTPSINSLLRRLLNADSAVVRIEAYKVLAAHGSADVQSNYLPRKGEDERFVLDIVPSNRPPIVYATRTGVPRIALIGQPSSVQTPIVFSGLDNRLTLSTRPGQEGVTLFYRQDGAYKPSQIQSRTDLSELIGWLGGAGRDAGSNIDLTYGEIVSIIAGLAEQKRLIPSPGTVAASSSTVQFVLQDVPAIEDEINDAPPIVPRVRQQSGQDTPSPFPTTRRVGPVVKKAEN